MSEPTDAEHMRYQERQKLREIVSKSMAGLEPTQFQQDFESIAYKLTDENWHKVPRPHNIEGFPLFRTNDLPRLLDIGALLRMARLIGIEELRYIFTLGQQDSSSTFRLKLEERKFLRNTRRGTQSREIERKMLAEQFGAKVLRLESTGMRRVAAYERAGQQLRLSFTDIRLLRKLFNEFAEQARRRGYISMGRMASYLNYSLLDLKPKIGRQKTRTKVKSRFVGD